MTTLSGASISVHWVLSMTSSCSIVLSLFAMADVIAGKPFYNSSWRRRGSAWVWCIAVCCPGNQPNQITYTKVQLRGIAGGTTARALGAVDSLRHCKEHDGSDTCLRQTLTSHL